MVDFIRSRASDRKLRLFAAACCRGVWDLLAFQESRDAVEVLERCADGLLPSSAMNSAWASASQVRIVRKPRKTDPRTQAVAAWAVSTALFPDVFTAVTSTSGQLRGLESLSDESERQCDLLRDLFGNPFRAAPAPPALPADAASLAQAAYDERELPLGSLDPARLCVLADALEEAGCTDESILTHLRTPSLHVRGCWALDLVLDNS
jgi:hypothetical protein